MEIRALVMSIHDQKLWESRQRDEKMRYNQVCSRARAQRGGRPSTFSSTPD